MTEMVVLIPLFLALAIGAAIIIYLCWQGLKVQQAANLAARIQGQERVAGGPDLLRIIQDNGIPPSIRNQQEITYDPNNPEAWKQMKARTENSALSGPTSVYGRIRTMIKNLFSPKEQESTIVMPPKFGLRSDRVRVYRVIEPPEVFGHRLPQVRLQGTAYGGEDTSMYGLVRWGKENARSSQDFWKSPDVLKKGNE